MGSILNRPTLRYQLFPHTGWTVSLQTGPNEVKPVLHRVLFLHDNLRTWCGSPYFSTGIQRFRLLVEYRAIVITPRWYILLYLTVSFRMSTRTGGCLREFHVANPPGLRRPASVPWEVDGIFYPVSDSPIGNPIDIPDMDLDRRVRVWCRCPDVTAAGSAEIIRADVMIQGFLQGAWYAPLQPEAR